MKVFGSVLVAALAMSVLAGPAEAGLLEKGAAKSAETIGPAAKGDPKPYQANANGTCGGATCVASFGKKQKVRKIRLVTCGMVGGEPQFGGVLIQSALQFYLPIASVAQSGGAKVGMFEFQFEFDVPPESTFEIYLQGTAVTEAACTATGTIG
jgi:hypothetical protein